MNYTTCTPVDMNAVCEKPRERTISPPLTEHLRYVSEAVVDMMNAVGQLEQYAIGDTPGYDNREDDTLTGYLAWFGRTMQETTRVLRRVQEVVR